MRSISTVVVLMVANVPWQKQGSRAITPADDRFAMVQAAVAEVAGLEAGDLEIRRGGASYTADTLAALAEEYPDADLYTVVGDDAAAGITTWERYDEVAAVPRWWWSIGRVRLSSCPSSSRGRGWRCPVSRCRRPTCALG